jgi:hypothetical protein
LRELKAERIEFSRKEVTDDIEDIPSSPNRRSAHRPGVFPSPPSTTLKKKKIISKNYSTGIL